MGTKRRGKLWVEVLESRILLSVESVFNPPAGLLEVTADGPESIAITEEDGAVLINGVNPGGAPDPVDASAIVSLSITANGDFPNTIDLTGLDPDAFSALTDVSVESGGGNDVVHGSPMADEIHGGPGDDTLYGGPGDDVLTGGAGTDTVLGEGGLDELYGENQPDTDFSNLGQDVWDFLSRLQDTLNTDVFLRPIPLLGDQLAGPEDSLSASWLADPSTIGQFIDGEEGFADDVQTGLSGLNSTSTAADVRQALYDVFAGQLGLLADLDSNSAVETADIVHSAQADGDSVFEMLLRRDIADNFSANEAAFILGTNPDFGENGYQDPVQWQYLEWLNEGKDRDVDVGLGFEFLLSFAVSETGFYEQTGPADEVTVDVAARIPDLQDREYYRIGLLEATISDFPARPNDLDDGPSHFSGTYTVDVLTADDVAARLNGEAEVNLLVDAKFFQGDSDINLRALSHLHVGGTIGERGNVESQSPWTFTDADPADYDEPFGDEVTVLFDEVRLDLDSFFGGFASDIIRRIQDVTKPLDPVIDVLNTELPVISDLGGPETIAEMIGGRTVADFVEAVEDINNIHVPESGSMGGAYVEMGWFQLSDPRLPNPVVADYEGNPNALEDSQEWYEDVFDPETTISLGKGPFYVSVTPSDEDGLHLPLFQDPVETYRLFAGQNATLLLYDLPQMAAGIGYEEFIPLFGSIGTTIGGYLEVGADLKFGYDTFGLAKYRESQNFFDILDGFFVFDQEIGPDGQPVGEDPNEFWIEMELGATMEVNVSFIVTVRAGVWGGLHGDVTFDLVDWTDPFTGRVDGHVRASELMEGASQGFECIFDTEGDLWGGLRAFVWVGISVDFGFFEIEIKLWDWSETLAKETLLDFSTSCPAATEPAPLAEYDPATGTLTLLSDVGDPYCDKDIFFVRPLSDPEKGEGLLVSGRGAREEYFGEINLIRANTGENDDIVMIMPGVTADAALSGGNGKDQLFYLGDGTAYLNGGAGADHLRSRNGDDVLIGGEGNDNIIGGSGMDWLEGGPGNDTLRGDGGEDEIYGNEGNDVLKGKEGDDWLEGGPGIDVVEWHEGDGSDTVLGGLNSGEGEENRYDELSLTFQDDANTVALVPAGGSAFVIDAGGGEGLSVDGIEKLSLLLGGGADEVTVADLSSTDLQSLEIDAGSLGVGDSEADHITLWGTELEDDVTFGLSNSITGGGAELATDPDETLGEAGELNLDLDPGDEPEGVIAVNGLSYSISTSGTTPGEDTLLIRGSGRDDTFTMLGYVGNLARVQVAGHSGLDTLIGWDAPASWNLTKNDAGVLTGSSQVTFSSIENLVGGSESDEFAIVPGKVLSGSIDGGDGIDTLDYSAYSKDLYVDLRVGVAPAVTRGVRRMENVIGGSGRDALLGDEGDNFLAGNLGDDALFGMAGEDVLEGGPGNDLMDGGMGDDTYVEVPGSYDSIADEGGIDTVDFSGAETAIYFDLRHRTGRPRWVDMQGNTISVVGVMENAIGGPYDDGLLGNELPNRLEGGPGRDTIYGWDGNDALYGGPGVDWLYGGNGDDTLSGGDHGDLLWGDAGMDLADYSGDPAPVKVQLHYRRGFDGYGSRDYFCLIEGAIGSAYGDVLEGDAGDNVLRGLAGDDEVLGREGADVFVWNRGDGSDDVRGGEGYDKQKVIGHESDEDCSVLAEGDSVRVIWNSEEATGSARGVENLTLQTGGGNDTVTVNPVASTGLQKVRVELGTGNDVLSTEMADVTVHAYGGPGDDELRSGRRSDVFSGDEGWDTVDYSHAPARVQLGYGGARDGMGGCDSIQSVEKVIGSAFADTLVATGSICEIWGGAGNDMLYDGGSRDNLFYGEEGEDSLFGGLGNDVLNGGPGDDWLDGGTGYDVFDFSGATGPVSIDWSGGTAHDGTGGKDRFQNMEGVA